ncbi:hypothetical protein CVS40_5582 [Lucilia cuprina]|nr:hypothetical protein CVS40_5582 [Lucilia cuprina]
MLNKYFLILIILLYYLAGVLVEKGVILKDLKCRLIDEEFFNLDKCDYITNTHNIEEFHLVLKLFPQRPITNCLLQLQFQLKTFTVPLKFNGTYDVCKFMKEQQKNRVLKRFYDIYKRYMNANHSCPYDHDVYFKSSKQIPFADNIPWPSGEYLFQSLWIIDKRIRFILAGTLGQSLARVTQLECEAIDKKFGYFETCGSKLSSNGIKEFNMILRLLQLPVTNCHIQLEVNVLSYIKIPLTFNATYDVCKFMENNSKNRILNRLYKAIGRFLNTNHTCPYNHDLYLSGLKEIPIPLRLPWPKAEYEFITTWLVDNIKRIHCKVIMKKVKCFNTGPTYFHIDKCELSNNLDNSTILKINLRYNHKPVENFETQLGNSGKIVVSRPNTEDDNNAEDADEKVDDNDDDDVEA